MKRDELIARFVAERAVFDARVAAVPAERVDVAPEGHAHSPKAIVAHVSAYEELTVERLRAAREGTTTSLERDRDGWKEFNERTWTRVAPLDPTEVRAHAREVFGDLLGELKRLTDEELAEPTGATAALDPAWLGKHAPWRIIAIDGFEHYPMHYEALDAAAAGPVGS